MHFIKLENPESPFLGQFSINMDRNISPVFMVEFQSMQPKSNASTYCFNKSFFKTPVPIEEQSNLHTEFEVTMHIIINIGMIFFSRVHCHDFDLIISSKNRNCIMLSTKTEVQGRRGGEQRTTLF